MRSAALPILPTDQQLCDMAAAFAERGHTFHKLDRAGDGRHRYIISHWAQSRCFSAWHDVNAFLAQIGGVL